MVEFGVSGVTDIMVKYPNKGAKVLIDEIMKSTDKFKGDLEYPDDLALMSIHFLD